MSAAQHGQKMNFNEIYGAKNMLNESEFRIYLRALEIEDYKKLHKWRMEAGYQSGVVSMKRFISSETEKNWVENAIKRHEQAKEIRLGIVLKENDEIMGLISLTNIDLINKNAVINSWIGEADQRKKGYIKEARYLILQYGFQELGLERISSTVLADNIGSRKAGEKVGYVQEGLLRRAVFKEGRFHDLIAYSVLKDEFLTKYKIQ